jgi:RHS repeat-associated protein
VLSTSILIDGEAFGIEQGYDQFNRPHFTTYPANNFTIKQSYTSLGYPKAITNATQGHREYGVAYETINDINARGQVTSKTLGNEVVETSVYEAKTGWLSSLDVAKGSTLHHALDYTYYNNGNLKTRTNDFAYSGSAKDFKDTFTYDGLNRLNKMTKTGGISSEENYRYDARGNFTYKQGTGYYKYDGSKKNRLSQIWTGSGFTGSKTHTFGYDNRGNVTSDGTRTFDYTAFDKPYLITKGSTKTEFSYGPGRGLYHQRLTVGGKVTDTLYVKGLYERAKLSTGVTEHKYHVGNVVITDRSNNANDTLYLHKDNLGSTVSITDSAGAIKQHLSYDAWGKQSAFNGHSSLTAYTSPATSQGYTGHKMMNDVGIIHMGGRIYDPTLGRFLQADPHIQAPKNSQNYNRYSYVLNNPMSYTDPSGYFFKSLGKFVKKHWRTIASIAIAVYLPGVAWVAELGTVGAGALTGFVSGAVATGSLKGALIGAFTGGMFGELHNMAAGIGKVAAHGAVGGIGSTLNGGKFGHGFISAGFTQAAGSVKGLFVEGAKAIGDRISNAITAAIIGGTSSVISGGKFASGAITGAFSRLLNDDAYTSRRKKQAGYDLKDGFEGFVDEFNYEGESRHEIHVYKNGTEVGIFQDGEWINKHGHSGTPDGFGDRNAKMLKGVDVHMMRRQGRIPKSRRFASGVLTRYGKYLPVVGFAPLVYDAITSTDPYSFYEGFGISQAGAGSTIHPDGVDVIYPTTEN